MLMCATCGKPSGKKRLHKGCKHAYCSGECSHEGRRLHRSKADKVARKAAYDADYRDKNGEILKRKKAERHRRTYTPEKGRAYRAAKKAAGWDHSAYCREYMSDPDRKAAKVKSDQIRQAKLRYGDNWEAAIALTELCKEVRAQEPSKYERLKARGYYDRNAQQRRRDAGIDRW